jgi:cytoskeletal protein CcmA (bactofilin family)
MFGNNKKETTKSKSGSLIPSGSPHALNSLVKGTVVEGTVNSESDIRIDGKIEGKLFCQAKVIIGPSGSVEGEIRCENAVFEGIFQGEVFVKDLLIVKEQASVHGDVTTKKLIVNSGAIFNVNCHMGETKARPKNGAQTAAPQAEKSSKVSEVSSNQ